MKYTVKCPVCSKRFERNGYPVTPFILNHHLAAPKVVCPGIGREGILVNA